MISAPSLIHVLLFLSAARHDEWKKDRLRQQAGLFDNETEQKRSTGQFSRYPLRGVDMFGNDCYRFVCEHKDAIGSLTVGDVYISSINGLHDDAEQQKEKSLYVLHNDHSGGLDFYQTKDKITDIAALKQRKADWRWVPVLKQFVPAPKEKIKTYIVINHPEKVCGTIDTGGVDARRVSIASWSLYDPSQEHRWLFQQEGISLMGNKTTWCEEQFTGDDETLGIKNLLQFIDNNPPR